MSAVAALALASVLLAQAPQHPDVLRAQRLQRTNESTQLLARLRALLPKTAISRVTRTEVPGLWRVEMDGGNVAYTDNSGRYLVLGLVIDLYSGQALDGALNGSSSHESAEE